MESCVASARLGNKERGTHVHTLAGPLIASSLLISSFFFSLLTRSSSTAPDGRRVAPRRLDKHPPHCGWRKGRRRRIRVWAWSTYLSVERREEEEEGPVSGAQPAGGWHDPTDEEPVSQWAASNWIGWCLGPISHLSPTNCCDFSFPPLCFYRAAKGEIVSRRWELWRPASWFVRSVVLFYVVVVPVWMSEVSGASSTDEESRLRRDGRRGEGGRRRTRWSAEDRLCSATWPCTRWAAAVYWPAPVSSSSWRSCRSWSTRRSWPLCWTWSRPPALPSTAPSSTARPTARGRRASRAAPSTSTSVGTSTSRTS